MDVKEASRRAKKYVIDVYRDENIANVGLEEAEFDELSDDWKITIGFSRPWNTKNPVTTVLGRSRPERSYKVVRIDDDGHVKSLTDRFLPAASA